MTKGEVWVWTEHYRGELARVSLGLLGKAHQLCQQRGEGEVAAVLAGTDSPQLVTELIEHGADKVYLAGDPALSPFDTELCAHFMSGLIASYQPDIVLWGATSSGRETAARTAARLGTGLTAHCIDLNIEEVEGSLQMVGVVAGWGGNLALKIICPEKRPQMATVKPGLFPPALPLLRKGQVIPVKMEGKTSRLEIVEVVEERQESAILEEAEVIVVGGWGLSSLGGFQAANDLAEAIGGTSAGTRPALDAGWIPAEKVIGAFRERLSSPAASSVPNLSWRWTKTLMPSSLRWLILASSATFERYYRS
ncbi:MAG: Electron transfer flavoprotein alpha/beta-subunit [Dehalococcoidales bacterium]|nr:Electron transfer flavoprotein alpha/beta-subunit [Dehalococcoidales bacterium]